MFDQHNADIARIVEVYRAAVAEMQAAGVDRAVLVPQRAHLHHAGQGGDQLVHIGVF